jgi:hypothetical protein
MDTLHTVLRSIRDNKSSRRDHLDVFREFLGHLDRIGRRAGVRTPTMPRRRKSSNPRKPK